MSVNATPGSENYAACRMACARPCGVIIPTDGFHPADACLRLGWYRQPTCVTAMPARRCGLLKAGMIRLAVVMRWPAHALASIHLHRRCEIGRSEGHEVNSLT